MSVTEDILNKLYYTDKNYGGLDQLYDKAKLVDKKITHLYTSLGLNHFCY